MKQNWLVLILLLSFSVQAQDWHWVVFTDKEGVSFDAESYFHPKALERRVREGLPLEHITDFPVKESYISTVQEMVDSTSYASRWFNALSVYATPNQIASLEELPFVKETQAMLTFKVDLAKADLDSSEQEQPYSLATAQLDVFGKQHFQDAEVDGSDVIVAVFDAGFPAVDTHPAFEHIRKENRILATYDFVQNHADVFGHSSHGTNVLSCIAGRLEDGKPNGLATGAKFILARTERGLLENFAEEKHWIAALEWADKNGAEIVNSSLGYTGHRYYPQEMDGRTSYVVKGANMAMRKGILVLNAAGNDGDSDWKYLGTPADSDSILTIGGIDPSSNYHISFSSFGPTAEGVMKPNLVGYGKAWVADPKGGFKVAFGTSFATPLVTGFAACARQLYPDLRVANLKSELENAGSLFPFYDYAHGYGVPQAAVILHHESEKEEQFKAWIENDLVQIQILIAPTEEQIKDGIDLQSNLYYHFANQAGRIRDFGVFDIPEEPNQFSLSLPKEGEVLRIHYQGQTVQITQ